MGGRANPNPKASTTYRTNSRRLTCVKSPSTSNPTAQANRVQRETEAVESKEDAYPVQVDYHGTPLQMDIPEVTVCQSRPSVWIEHITRCQGRRLEENQGRKTRSESFQG